MSAPVVGLVDHGMGNMRSVAKALEVAGAVVVTVDDDTLPAALDALCVPGQGIFGRCMRELGERKLDVAISRWVSAARPYLGICLGLQVLLDESAEPDDPSKSPNGTSTPGLGIIPGSVVPLPAYEVTIPHIGWNVVTRRDAAGGYFYFDHSYVAAPSDPAVVAGTTEHGAPFAAVLEAGSILAVQFHPEKSGRSGISLLQEWVEHI